uniref:Apyrase n=1 Tax=Nyssomyia neivai TaxID=330878 RepID=A0A1L8DXM0_9DIPT
MSTQLLLRESSEDSTMYIRDWRKALRSPPSYKVGNRTLRFRTHFVWILVALACLVLVLLYVGPVSKYQDTGASTNWAAAPSLNPTYNYTYPLSAPIITNGLQTYRIGIIADLDTESKSKGEKNVWRSFLKKGYLKYHPTKETIVVSWDKGDDTELTSSYALKDRGMELSELVTFNGKLLSFDDRTGLIYEIINGRVAQPWLLLMDGDGHTTKGFKAEWATVKDHVLYVGSMGKEWTTPEGDFVNNNPMFVKVVSPNGEVRHLNWVGSFKAIRSAMDITWPGYMIHESGMWSQLHRRWYFLPRRCSKEPYNETRDEFMGCNALIECEEYFKTVRVIPNGDTSKPTHGFSSFKFIPGTDDRVIVALKTEELKGKTSTFITAFTTSGKTLLPEERIPTDYKFEGIEFI